jgi:Xaa-Pro dipeptidase
MQGPEESYQDFLTPLPEIERRTRAVQTLLRESELTALLLLHPVHLFYFAGTVQNGLLWIPAEGTPVFWVVRSLERARAESPLAEIRPRENLPELDRLAPEGPSCRIGLELDVLPERDFQRVRKLLPDRSLVDAAHLIQRVRQIKSDFELGWMRRAGKLHAEVFREIPAWIRVGMTELELSARIEYALRARGHQGLIQVHRWNLNLFYGPVVSGPSASYPSFFDGPVGAQGLYPAVPQGGGRRKIAAGEPILIDLVFGFNGYFVDQSRTFVPGEPDRECLEVHELCRRILEAAVLKLQPGRTCAELYREVTQAFEKTTPHWPNFMGFRDNRVQFIGHGVGLELDEWPVLAPKCEEVLRPGMTLAVEPKLFLGDRGGIGLENTYHVTESGPEKLTDFPDDLVVVPG